MYNFLLFLFLPFLVFAFNDDYESVSSLDENGKYVNSRTLANLPYSACKTETVQLGDNCVLVSLGFGSKIFNALYYNPAIIRGLDFKKVSKSTALDLVRNYFIGSQDLSIKWSIPTVPQLEWMNKNILIKPIAGEYYWALAKDGKLKRVFYKRSGPDQGGTLAGIQRLANNNTPSSCTEDVDCTLFGEKKPYYIRVYRANLVHSMGYKVSYTYKGKLVEEKGFSRFWGVFKIPVGATGVGVTYCKKNTFNCDMKAKLPVPNFNYAEPTICIASHGHQLYTYITTHVASSPSAC